MDRAQRRLAMIDGRLRRAERGEDRVRPGRRLGEGHEAAVHQLQRRRMDALARIEDDVHQRRRGGGGWIRSAGWNGQDRICRIPRQRSAGRRP